MPSITFDGQSFMVDGRRLWLASGAIHYSRVPRGLWRDRIRAARQAGLNCIETYVFWNVHEPEPGRFVFEGDADLRAFVAMIGEEGMWCILRAWALCLFRVGFRRAPGMARPRRGHAAAAGGS